VTTHNIEAMKLIGFESSLFYYEINLHCVAAVDEIVKIVKIGNGVNKVNIDVDLNVKSIEIPIEALDYVKYKTKPSFLTWSDINHEIQCHVIKDSL
jgi:copper chaperone CopZ